MSWFGDLVDRAKGWLAPSQTTLGTPAQEQPAHDAVRHTRFDAVLFDELLETAPALKQVVTDLHRNYAHTDDLMRDVLMQFYQAAPAVRDRSEMRTSHLANHAVAVSIAAAPETPLTRTYTQHDKYGATMAAIGVSSKVREYLQQQKELTEAAEQAEQAERERQQAEESLQEALGGAEAADAACQAAMGGYEGEGPLTAEQAQAQERVAEQGQALQQSLEALQEATDAAGDCQQQAMAEAERARLALRAPIEQAVKQVGDDLAKEAALFRGWGVDDAEVENMSFEERAKMARLLQSHHLSEFVQELGRWRAMQKAQYAKRTVKARDEVYDVELTGNLPDVIASELAHLGSDMGRLDFMIRMSEGQLLGKKYRGKERQGQGGIFCLIDTSSSMKQKDQGGKPRELFAKGTGLAMLAQARAEKRDFVGIVFSTVGKIKVFHFPKGESDLQQVLDFTSTFLAGGTDFQGPLDLAMELIEKDFNTEGRAKADMVLITDDECKVTAEWEAQFKARKDKTGVRLFGLALGMKQPGSTLTKLSDNVRAINEFADPAQVNDLIHTI